MLSNLAHVKWFVDSNEVLEAQSTSYPWSSGQVLSLVAVGLFVIIAAVIIERRFPSPSKKFLKKADDLKPKLMRIFTALMGIFLISVGVFWSVILTPELKAEANVFTQILRAIEIACGVLFISGLRPTLGAKTLAGLFVATGLMVGPVFFLENLLLAGAALYIYTYYTGSKSFKKQWEVWALPLLRVTTGISLIAFAFSEKLIHPELSQVFLGDHSWNFLSNWGVTAFNNNVFILTAGVVETIFGILFILGVATRITTLAIGGLFATSVVTMLATKGNWEVEDLPVYAIAIILLAYGSGKRLLVNRRDIK